MARSTVFAVVLLALVCAASARKLAQFQVPVTSFPGNGNGNGNGNAGSGNGVGNGVG